MSVVPSWIFLPPADKSGYISLDGALVMATLLASA